jgi:hypothetical protein
MERPEFRKAGSKVALGAGLILAASTLSGCADLMAKSAVAPAWFQSKAVEVKGEGYPDIHKVPKVRGTFKDQPVWDAEGKKLKGMGQSIDDQNAAAGAIADPDAIRAREAQLRAYVEQGGKLPDDTKP